MGFSADPLGPIPDAKGSGDGGYGQRVHQCAINALRNEWLRVSLLESLGELVPVGD